MWCNYCSKINAVNSGSLSSIFISIRLVLYKEFFSNNVYFIHLNLRILNIPLIDLVPVCCIL